MPTEPSNGLRQPTRVGLQAFCRLAHLAALAAQTGRSTAMTEIAEAPATAETDTLVERLVGAAIGALELASIHLGGRLGFYQALADGGDATPTELANRTGTASRYVREWLEQQAVGGFLAVDHSDARPDERRYHLPDPHRAVFVDEENLNYLTPLATLAVGVLGPIDALLATYRTGGGVRYEDYGADVREGIEALNRPMFANQLADWLGAVPEIDHRLRGEPPARVADLACGSGWSSVAIAQAYPTVTVDALDVDVASIETATAKVAAAGLAGRVHPAVADASAPDLGGPYDLITIFEALHDMNHPVAALRAARNSLTDGGSVLVADERVAERFTAPGDELERFNYGWSVPHCLAVGLLDDDSAGTGTVLRPDTIRAYAADAGFDRVELLPIDHDFWRFYRLAP
jgi:2-polyprenyl-3-methyl-5-hydroxy-6-metoxy-1,4-benzoquinol methylase